MPCLHNPLTRFRSLVSSASYQSGARYHLFSHQTPSSHLGTYRREAPGLPSRQLLLWCFPEIPWLRDLLCCSSLPCVSAGCVDSLSLSLFLFEGLCCMDGGSGQLDLNPLQQHRIICTRRSSLPVGMGRLTLQVFTLHMKREMSSQITQEVQFYNPPSLINSFEFNVFWIIMSDYTN